MTIDDDMWYGLGGPSADHPAVNASIPRTALKNFPTVLVSVFCDHGEQSLIPVSEDWPCHVPGDRIVKRP